MNHKEQIGIAREAVNIYRNALKNSPEDTHAEIRALDHIENYYNGDIFGDECQSAIRLFNATINTKGRL